MYPNLDAEQARHGHTDDYVARVLGISVEEYQKRKASRSIGLQEAVALEAMYEQSTEYLFRAER